MDDDENAAMISQEKQFRSALQNADGRAAHILVYHALFEKELGRLIGVILPRGEQLAGMGYANLVRVFRAAYWAQPEITDSMVQFLRLFGEMRNAIAHGEASKIIDAWIVKLQAHYATMPGTEAVGDGDTLDEMASDIAGTLGGMIYKLERQRPAFPESQ